MNEIRLYYRLCNNYRVINPHIKVILTSDKINLYLTNPMILVMNVCTYLYSSYDTVFQKNICTLPKYLQDRMSVVFDIEW